VPWGSIVLAAFLTVFGAVCFVLAWMHFTQQIFGKEQAEIAFSLVGLLTFIPGVYGCGCATLQLALSGRALCAECCGAPAQVHTTPGSPSVSGGASQATTGEPLSQPSAQ
jgi:hypothetical protein